VHDIPKATVAIVEDDESVREAIEGWINVVGFRARAFASAPDFLASPDIKDIVCLVADINMPTMTGIELHRRLADLGYAIPTILITAFPDEAVCARALADGVICYLVKPFDDEDLLRCIRLAIGDPSG
jgi:FixJ family two-component response regulator